MSEDKSKLDSTSDVENLDNALEMKLPIDDENLSDSDLKNGDVIKTPAFVRSNKSKNSIRFKRHKEKKAETGIKQLNVQIPE